MDLELREEEERSYRFRPLSWQFTRSSEWDGTLSDARWLWPWMHPYRRRLLVAGILFLSTTLISLAIPRLLAKIIDDVLVAKIAHFELWGGILAGLILFKITADLCFKWTLTKTGQSITTRIRSDIFYQLGTFPLNFFDRNSSGKMISRCVNDITNLASFFNANFFSIFNDIALIIGSLLFLLWLSPKAALIVALTLIPMSIFMFNVSQAQMRWGRSMRNIMSRLSSHTGDSMNNLAILHSQPYAPKWARRHARLQRQYTQLTINSIQVWGSFSAVHVLVMGITYTMVIALGIHQLRQSEISIGRMIASFAYVGLIFGPFFEISEKINSMVTALGSVKRLRALMPARINAPTPRETEAALPPQGSVRFEHLKFSYRPDRPLFDDLNLEMPEGEVTALVGRTGSGKTTLAHLMLGLYPLQGGRICWGNEDIQSFSPIRRARWIGHVSQDLFIFTDTLRENLRLWRDEITDAQIFERLELVGLAAKIKALPGGLDMVVKAETLPLSQGEKQLLLLCRALLQDPRLLVFDEATASLDLLTEEQWLGQVAKVFQGRTTLFIAHRLETLRLASYIVVMNNGRIVKTFRKPVGQTVSPKDLI
jgi:ABC-type multidrug transport system fused ATPase/permease subunit